MCKYSRTTRELTKIIRTHGPISRKCIARLAKQSLSKTTVLLAEMKSQGIIELIEGKSTGGRTPSLIKLRNDLFYSVGVDIGSENLRIGIIDSCGNIVSKYLQKYHIEHIRDIAVSFIAEKIIQLADEANISPKRICSAGIGITGIVNEALGICLSLRNTPTWKNLNVSHKLKSLTKIPHVYVVDSVRAMTFAEKLYGQCKDLENFVLVSIGIGLGAGIVIHGHLLSGENGTTGEIGHIFIRPSSKQCICGNYGCLEAVSSGWALLIKCKESISNGVVTTIGSGKSISDINLDDIIQAAHEGDKFALSIMDNMSKDIALGLSSVINLINPQRVVLAGGLITNAADHMLDPIINGVRQNVIPWITKNIDIRITSLDEWSGVLGAASIATNRLLDEELIC